MKCKATGALLITLLAGLTVAAQDNSERLSIRNDVGMAMSLEDPSETQLDSIIELGLDYVYMNEDTAMLITDRTLNLAERLYEGEQVHGHAVKVKGRFYTILGELDHAEEMLLKAQLIYESLSLHDDVAETNRLLGRVFFNNSQYDRATEHYLMAIATWEEGNDSAHVYRPYIDLAQLFFVMGQEKKGLEYNTKALRIAEAKNYIGAKMMTISNQGTVYKEWAMGFQVKADSFPSDANRWLDSSTIYFDKSLDSYNYALNVGLEHGALRSVIGSYIEIADVLIPLKRFDEAAASCEQARKYSLKLGSEYGVAESNQLLTRVHLEAGKLDKAISAGEQALTLEDNANNSMLRAVVQKDLYLAHKGKSQYDEALHYFEAYQNYKTEEDRIEQNEIISEVEAKYQNAQKQQQILEQENDILALEKSNTRITTQRNYLMGGALSLGVLGLLGFQLNKARKERNDRKAFPEALIYAQEEERKRIARDLHDGVGQSLLLIKKQLETTTDATLKNQNLISDTLEEVRSISQDLHPFQLEKFGLAASIAEMVEKMKRSSGIFITSDIDKTDKLNLSDQIEINIFRTVQEALNNIVKHAAATAAKVSLKVNNNQLDISIQDNGKGFDHELAVVTSKSLGLRTMHERVTNIGGKFEIKKGASGGTEIIAKVSL